MNPVLDKEQTENITVQSETTITQSSLGEQLSEQTFNDLFPERN